LNWLHTFEQEKNCARHVHHTRAALVYKLKSDKAECPSFIGLVAVCNKLEDTFVLSNFITVLIRFFLICIIVTTIISLWEVFGEYVIVTRQTIIIFNDILEQALFVDIV
jgi:hypothetical protein